jgi:hypothetical protein
VRERLRRGSYLFAFFLVGACSLVLTSAWIFSRFGIRAGYTGWMTLPELFGSPVPIVFRYVVPEWLRVLAMAGLALLALRRLWLMLRARSPAVPDRYRGWVHYLMLALLASLLLGILVLAASILFRLGSGVPAALIGMPGVLLLPGYVALVELLSMLPQKRTMPA